MPTSVKSSSTIAKLGDISTYSVKTSAVPYDTVDTSGAVPTMSVTLAQGADADYQIGETLTLSNQAVGTYSGEIVGVSASGNSGRSTLDATTFLDRLNSDQRLYALSAYTSPSAAGPISALEYWSQQCGVLFDAVPGDVLMYQSQFAHFFAFAKGTTQPVRGIVLTPPSGGEKVTTALLGTRYVTTFGLNTSMTTAFPSQQFLPVQIPAASDPKVMVFSTAVYNQGTGRQGSVIWNLVTPMGKKLAVKLVIDNNAGVTLSKSEDGTTYTTIGTVAGAVNGNYRINVGVKSTSSTQTQFTLSVLNTNSAVVGTQTLTATSSIAGNLSLTSLVHRGENQGSGSSLLHWGDCITILPAMPTLRFTEQKSFTAGNKATAVFPGFSGNVWENIKAYCSVYFLDVSCTDGKLTFGPRQTTVVNSPSLSELTTKLSKRDQARFVEVVNQNSQATISGGIVTPQVMWKADTVYQVAVGEVQTFTVQTKNSILDLSQPVAVSGISPYPYTSGAGQYVVTGSDGYIVDPQFWRDQGGLITVATTDNEGEISVTIKGPDFDSARAPYRISEGDAGRPALYVTGTGLVNTPTTIRVSTGNTKAAKEVGVTLDNPFITDVTLAYDAAVRAARAFAVPDRSVTVNEPLDFDHPSVLGKIPSGALVNRNGNILRITDATQNHSGVNGNATPHNTISQVTASFGSTATIGDLKTYYAGKTIGQTNLKPLKQVK